MIKDASIIPSIYFFSIIFFLFPLAGLSYLFEEGFDWMPQTERFLTLWIYGVVVVLPFAGVTWWISKNKFLPLIILFGFGSLPLLIYAVAIFSLILSRL